jgi:8-oxo-dGTP diphosphatase
MGRPTTPLLTVDCVAYLEGGVVLIRRANPPFAGGYALPGGFVDLGETVERACARELAEETGLVVRPEALRLVGVYSAPERDPRGHTVSVAFTVQAGGQTPRAGDDAAAVAVIADWGALELAFDHRRILEDAERLWLQDQD